MAPFKRRTSGKRKSTGELGEWFYCLRHQKVEEGPECPAKDRLGPYADPAEAARAVEITREREEEWRHDPRWSDEDPGADRPSDRG